MYGYGFGELPSFGSYEQMRYASSIFRGRGR
jgi:hypothetical protein